HRATRVASPHSSLHPVATSAPHTLSLHDALPIYRRTRPRTAYARPAQQFRLGARHAATYRRIRLDLAQTLERRIAHGATGVEDRSEEHTSELQSRENLVCRLLLEKK